MEGTKTTSALRCHCRIQRRVIGNQDHSPAQWGHHQRGRPPFPVERRPKSLVCALFNPSLVEKGRGRSFWL